MWCPRQCGCPLVPGYPSGGRRALVGHEQHIIVRRTDKKFLSKVVVLLGHALHAAAAAVLSAGRCPAWCA